MNLLRTFGRVMLGSYFVVNGAKSVANPEPLLADAQPLVDKLVPLVKQNTPANVAGFIPTSATTLVRLNGAMQVAGGLSLATGLGRRCGAGMLALAIVPHLVAGNPMKGVDAADKAERRKNAMRNAALLGGALLASQDLEGKPSLAWRAEQQQRRLAKKGEKTARQLKAEAKATKKAAIKTTKQLTKAAKRQASRVGGQVAEILPG